MDSMQALLAGELARVVQLPVAQIDYQNNIMHLGIDSLMAVELQTALQSKFALQMSALEFIRGLSIAQLAERLLAGIAPDLELLTAQGAVPEDALDGLLQAEMANISDAEWEQLVKQEIQEGVDDGSRGNGTAPGAIVLNGQTASAGASVTGEIATAGGAA
jgi:acyl carrier protein